MPVEQIREGDVVVLPSGRRVVVERVDVYDDDAYVVRWKAGSYRGSLKPVRAGDEWEVVRL